MWGAPLKMSKCWFKNKIKLQRCRVGQNSVVSRATHYRLGILSFKPCWGRDFDPETHPASCISVTQPWVHIPPRVREDMLKVCKI
jgi:hypothetical protein